MKRMQKNVQARGLSGLSERKRTPFLYSGVTQEGVFEGYASLFGEEDLGHDVVMPGAFETSLTERGAAGVKMLFQHDPKDPLGVWQILREDANGLWVRGELTLEVARAREVHALMKAGAVDGLSIGYHTVRASQDAQNGVRRLLQVDLWEISIVTFPMLPEARVHAVKEESSVPSALALERTLVHQAGLDPGQARLLMKGGYPALTQIHAIHPSPPDDLAASIRAAASVFQNRKYFSRARYFSGSPVFSRHRREL